MYVYLYRHWNLIICSSCGSKGLHIGCGKLGSHTKKWECDGCRRIVGKRSSIHNHRNLVSNCLEAPSSSAVVSQKNRMVAHKRPYPDEEEEGHRSSTSNSCRDENDTGSEVEIIDIIPAQDSSSRPKYPRINSGQALYKIHLHLKTFVHSKIYLIILLF